MHAPSNHLRCYLMLLHDCGLYFDRDELEPKNLGETPSTFLPECGLFCLSNQLPWGYFRGEPGTRDREGGGREIGMKSKWYLSHGGANLPCDERSWVKFGKSLQGKNLRDQRRSFFTSWGNQHHILMMILLYSFCYFFILWWGSPLGRKGDWASGCRGSLELWPIESFSGPGSRSADEARLNIANRSWKICTCAGSPSAPATPGLVPSWESGYFYMCAGRHAHTHTRTHALHAYSPHNWREEWKAKLRKRGKCQEWWENEK